MEGTRSSRGFSPKLLVAAVAVVAMSVVASTGFARSGASFRDHRRLHVHRHASADRGRTRGGAQGRRPDGAGAEGQDDRRHPAVGYLGAEHRRPRHRSADREDVRLQGDRLRSELRSAEGRTMCDLDRRPEPERDLLCQYQHGFDGLGLPGRGVAEDPVVQRRQRRRAGPGSLRLWRPGLRADKDRRQVPLPADGGPEPGQEGHAVRDRGAHGGDRQQERGCPARPRREGGRERGADQP